jgi:hypothetical protein
MDWRIRGPNGPYRYSLNFLKIDFEITDLYLDRRETLLMIDRCPVAWELDGVIVLQQYSNTVIDEC